MSAFSVFDPLLGRLIATDVRIPRYLRYLVKILGTVDIHFAVFVGGFTHSIISFYGVVWDVLHYGRAFK